MFHIFKKKSRMPVKTGKKKESFDPHKFLDSGGTEFELFCMLAVDVITHAYAFTNSTNCALSIIDEYNNEIEEIKRCRMRDEKETDPKTKTLYMQCTDFLVHDHNNSPNDINDYLTMRNTADLLFGVNAIDILEDIKDRVQNKDLLKPEAFCDIQLPDDTMNEIKNRILKRSHNGELEEIRYPSRKEILHYLLVSHWGYLAGKDANYKNFEPLYPNGDNIIINYADPYDWSRTYNYRSGAELMDYLRYCVKEDSISIPDEGKEEFRTLLTKLDKEGIDRVPESLEPEVNASLKKWFDIQRNSYAEPNYWEMLSKEVVE